MGAWGTDPWDNDKAADFFGDIWEAAPIVDQVHAGLGSNDGSEMVAALWLCSCLCRAYVWPIDRLDETLALAIKTADRLINGQDEDRYLDLWDDPTVTAQVEGFRSELASRQRT
jgi:hypothetical protein